jgi:tRNA nucleotidyltransferase/poly(A) polymerase
MMAYPNLEIWIFGGAVRNLLLGLKVTPKDFDFIFSGSNVAESIELLKQYGDIIVGPFGSPRWFPTQSVTYSDILQATRFKAGLWPCEVTLDVLHFLDFTANAIAVDLRRKIVLDPHNGRRDISRRILRATRFDHLLTELTIEDKRLSVGAVHWFRFLHYAQELDLQIDPTTWQWIIANAKYLEFEAEFTELFFKPNLKRLYSTE